MITLISCIQHNGVYIKMNFFRHFSSGFLDQDADPAWIGFAVWLHPRHHRWTCWRESAQSGFGGQQWLFWASFQARERCLLPWRCLPWSCSETHRRFHLQWRHHRSERRFVGDIPDRPLHASRSFVRKVSERERRTEKMIKTCMQLKPNRIFEWN